MYNTNIGDYLSKLRKDMQLSLKELSVIAGLDVSLLSRYESRKRYPSEQQLSILAVTFGVPFEDLHKLLLREKVIDIVSSYPYCDQVLMAAEERVEYLSMSGVKKIPEPGNDIKKKLAVIDQLKATWEAIKPLDPLQLRKLREYYRVKYTYDSNRIEGNTLTMSETHLVIQEGVTISGKSLKEHLEAINHADAIDYLARLSNGKEEFSERVLLEIHQLVLKGVDTRHAGHYRTVQVSISGSEHQPPEPYMLAKMMEDYFLFYKKNKNHVHPIILAAEMKERFVTIHPFIDGNGRTSRLIMNLILLKHGYTTLILKGDNDSRVKYFSALEKVQLDADSSSFHHLILDEAIISLQDHISRV